LRSGIEQIAVVDGSLTPTNPGCFDTIRELYRALTIKGMEEVRMSRRLAVHSLNRGNSRIAKFFLALGLFAGSVFACVANSTVRADDPDPLGVDDRPPLPPTEPKRAALAVKYRIPGTKAAIFVGRKDPKTGNIDGGIQNFKPIATEKENSDEYQAWHTVVSHAKQFTTTELEQNGGRDMTRDDLLNTPSRFTYRLELLRFEGKLTRIRWARATKSLSDAGTEKVYEALFVPVDEAPNALVSVVFTELPPELAAVEQKAEGEWMDSNAEIVVAGYFFKVKMDGPGQDPIPLLIGRSITIRKPAPNATPNATPGAETPIPLDKNLRVYRLIRDNAFIAKAEDNWEEVSAWNRILLHARRFLPADLENAATERKFADLFTDGRRDFKLDLVKFEGRLIMLNKMKPSEKLQAAGVETVYEGWIVPKDEPRGNPVCVVFTDPIEGLEGITGRVNKWVTFAGYSFKLMWYKSGERDKDDQNKNVTKKAPLLLGRAVIERPDPDRPPPVTWGNFFVPMATGGVLLILVFALGMSWWFRRGDKQARHEIDTHRGKNPFGEAGPAVS